MRLVVVAAAIVVYGYGACVPQDGGLAEANLLLAPTSYASRLEYEMRDCPSCMKNVDGFVFAMRS